MPPRDLRHARLRIGERVDDAAEQDRFDEHRRGERQVGEREYPAQTGFAPEHLEYAEVETKEFHAAGVSNLGGSYSMFRLDGAGPGLRRPLGRKSLALRRRVTPTGCALARDACAQ